METVLLYYKYIYIPYPKRVVKWQQKVCSELGLTGRILIGNEGINGTVAGLSENTQRYKEIMNKHPLFTEIDFKESTGGAHCFPKLKIQVKNEIVHLGVDPKKITPENGGIHLTPQETHTLIQENPDDLVILDTRNNFEWKIGKFTNAITPNIEHFRDFPEYLDKNAEQFKDKQVLMYCTGGIRCERASTLLKNKNIAKKVYQIEGGIHRYTEQYPDGFFRGKNYVFDNRISIKINDDILGTCEICDISCDTYTNCLNALCNKHFISCLNCIKKLNNTCSSKCHELIIQNKAPKRPERQQTTTSKKDVTFGIYATKKQI